MSDELLIFGTPFPSIENDNKNYVPVWKQKAVSTKGTKRFHGAFEGGFSAGYFNSVGSKEGWKPSEFISSRDKRYGKNDSISSIDKIENYMDEEDMAEFNSKELILIDHTKSNDVGKILKLNGISENTNFALHGDPLQLMSKYMKSQRTINDSHKRETSEAFSGGGAWDDDDDERPEFYEKDSSLHHVAKLIESSNQNLDEMVTLAFGNFCFISTENNLQKIEIPSDYITRKVIGISNFDLSSNKKSNSTDKYKMSTDNQLIDVDEKTASAALKGFMPFDEDPEKQSRYIKYLRFCNDKSGKADVPKSNLYLDEKEREEFIMSAQIFRPSSSVISSRFESSSTSLQPQVQLKAGLSRPDFSKKHSNPKEFEPPSILHQPVTKINDCLTQRINYVWAPSSLLCKRFNVIAPETGLASTIEPKKPKPALASESIEQIVSVLLKDSKHKVKFESGDNNKNESEIALPKLPSNDIFEEIFGPSIVGTQTRENRPKAIDYFE